ncbi:TetR/AcrR family transcriptional regulator [Cellulomonas sp. KRMCY2]|uniref:TetR/AcrR family transcriptional regulator n=1 Tax=Cellulomonas sp. KRMCY2 TaxID=1304865 RepID=UPI00045E63E8|nr:TetR/AcrR family transcriptional regulator [Cellulomonas sp. KRMCY2]
MPKITEPTIAEHRAKQRAVILRAAEEIALERGGAAVTVTAVAARSGLARPSVYAYFASADEMLVTLVLEGFDRWRAALSHATGDAAAPQDLVRAYFAAAAGSAAAGNHRLAAALTGVELPADVQASLLTGHRESAAPLAAAIRDLGAGGPGTEPDEAVLALLMSLVSHCIARVEAGHAPGPEARLAAELAIGGLERLARA